MRYLSIAIVLFASLIFSFSPSVGQEPKTRLFRVAMEISVDGEVAGSPVVIVEPGASATMTSTRDNGYSVKATLGTTGGLATASIPLTAELYRAEKGRWVKAGEPTLFVVPGRDASVSIALPDQPLVRFSVKIEPTTPGRYSNLPGFGKNACTAAKLASWKTSMGKPVAEFSLAAAQRVPPEPGQRCCTVCQGVRCCSNGPICCSDRTLCGSASCCA